MSPLHSYFDGAALVAIAGMFFTFIGLALKLHKRMNRDESLKRDYPPHRHINGKIAYSDDYPPAVIESLG